MVARGAQMAPRRISCHVAGPAAFRDTRANQVSELGLMTSIGREPSRASPRSVHLHTPSHR